MDCISIHAMGEIENLAKMVVRFLPLDVSSEPEQTSATQRWFR